MLKAYRVELNHKPGIAMNAEIHARDLVGGRGHLNESTKIPRHWRIKIFEGMLSLAAQMPMVRLFNVCLKTREHEDVQLTAWDRMLNRIDRTMQEFDVSEELKRRRWIEQIQRVNASAIDAHQITRPDMLQIAARLKLFRSRAIVIADEGREHQITSAFRKMHVFNHVPSQFGKWENGSPTKNIPARRIIEDPIFKQSNRSYFLQLIDCIAFALLKRDVVPTKRIAELGVPPMFEQHLAGICYLPACRRDPLGIVRK
jgi:hypothetical protein